MPKKKLRGNQLNTPESDNRLGLCIQRKVADNPGILRDVLISEVAKEAGTKPSNVETSISTCLIDARIYPYDTQEGRRYYPYTAEWVQHRVYRWNGKLDPTQQAPSPWAQRRHSATGQESTKVSLKELDRIQGIISTMRQMARDGQQLTRATIAARSGCRLDAFTHSATLKSLLMQVDDLQRLACSMPDNRGVIKLLIVAILEDDQPNVRHYYSVLGVRKWA